MDDRQNKLIIAGIAIVVIAGLVWFFFLRGSKTSVTDAPKEKMGKPSKPQQAPQQSNMPPPS